MIWSLLKKVEKMAEDCDWSEDQTEASPDAELRAKVERLNNEIKEHDDLVTAWENVLLKHEQRAEKAEAANVELVGALGFYANKENYNDDCAPGNWVGDYLNPDVWEYDEGRIAQQAIKQAGVSDG